ncbi:gamma-glutamyl-gamma-aminobutyrate hydrolase family protein [Paenibacillus flagellatus]|uniref:Gamma-glutamyl-gamma-aminobutyrate hydrolase n=1 Tax=Paenibacillus flagellatus TaxID=2211139 RepID=A0A2V5KCF1_9BACL|nr:gamma-glutamyl-gamma-aminobutyrate hydrolase family protein [Paenibacillus flagellatus]PYI55623.1 gamma-glutamyl-gamma-aminobutyrate hydrolase [Paenibacillus flagellatus]
MKPIIGVTSSIKEGKTVTTGMDNARSVIQAGGVPVVLPSVTDESALERLAATLDGLLVTGGGDVDPTLYGEEPHPALGEVCPERDRFELAIVRRFLALDKPIFGICRGCQLLNVAANGDMFQDIHAQAGRTLLQHYQKSPRGHATHFVDIEERSLLYRIVGERRLKVNSFHHQAVRKPGDGFVITAASGDGIAEAIESGRHRFALGVQWHPENMTGAGDRPSRQLFEAFVQACVT